MTKKKSFFFLNAVYHHDHNKISQNHDIITLNNLVIFFEQFQVILLNFTISINQYILKNMTLTISGANKNI